MSPVLKLNGLWLQWACRRQPPSAQWWMPSARISWARTVLSRLLRYWNLHWLKISFLIPLWRQWGLSVTQACPRGWLTLSGGRVVTQSVMGKRYLMKPLKLISTLEWAQRMVKLDEGKFSAAQYPQLTDIAETVDRRRGCTFILRFPPQTHKSLFMQLRLARTIAVGPQRSLWYCVTGKDADDFSDEKLTPLLESCQPVLARLPYDPRDRGGKKIFKFKAPLSLLSSEVQAHRNQRSAKDLYLDEAWQYPHGAVAEIRARSDSFQAVRRIIIGETGPDEGGETDLLFQRSPQKTWMVACPLCNRPVELEFGDAETESGIKWDKNEKTCNSEGFWNAELAARTVRWVCPACHGVVKYSPGILATMNSPARNAG